jgi:epoxyqueuosine reductase QueG
MAERSHELSGLIAATIRRQVSEADTTTEYREPLVGFASAADARFGELQQAVHPTHALPDDLLPGARSVVSLFLPFAPWVIEANAQYQEQVAEEWAVAYVETNRLIDHITGVLIQRLAEQGIRAAAEPATHNFDTESLVSRWSHKSVAVIAGLGSFGLHQMVITDAGCAGRFGSLVLDAELSIPPVAAKERCLYFVDGSCLECVTHCPVDALNPDQALDKQTCWHRLQYIAKVFESLGRAGACGKCTIGPCSLESAVL